MLFEIAVLLTKVRRETHFAHFFELVGIFRGVSCLSEWRLLGRTLRHHARPHERNLTDMYIVLVVAHILLALRVQRRERVRQIAEDKLRYVDYRPTFDSRHNVERWLAKAYRRGDTKAYDDALAELDPDTRARVETRLREQRERLRRLAAAGPRSQEARDAAAAAAAAEAAAVDEEARRVAESEAEAALLRAAREGRWRDVDDALAEGRSHPFVCDEQGFTLLHYAARNNSRKLAKVRRAMWLRSALTGDESVHCCEGHLLHLATRLYNSTALSY